MTKKHKKFYAVRVGKVPGIYESWEDCEKQIKGFPGAEYKLFKNIIEAEEFLSLVSNSNTEVTDSKKIDYDLLVSEDIIEGYVVAFTDGSHNSETNQSSYGIHFTYVTEEELLSTEEVSSLVYSKRFSESNNIVGEVFGVINAFEWCLKNGFEKISVYCDYEGLLKWEDGSWQAKSSIAMFYLEKLEEYKIMLDIKFTWVKGHSNISQNENADILAKNVLKYGKQKFKTGENFFTGTVENIEEINNIITEINSELKIDVDKTDVKNGEKRTLRYEKEKLHVTFYSSKRTILVQGVPGYLYSMFLSYYSDSLEAFNIIRTYSDAYESTIKTEYVEEYLNDLKLPVDYPESYKTLIRQAISSLRVKKIQEYDYSHYTVPAYRALEGNLRYLFEKAGYHVNEKTQIGHHFDKNNNGEYYLKTKEIMKHPFKDNIESCYNHYYYERHPQMHTGEIGIIDSTKLITTLEDAKEEISEVLSLLKF